MNKAIAWYRFAHRVWLSLSIGWCFVLAGFFTPYLRLDRAGAFLICGAIVAEVFNEKKHRLFIDQMNPGSDRLYLYQEVDVHEILGELQYELTWSGHSGSS